MNQLNFHCSTVVNVSIEIAFKAVRSRISEWWGKEVQGRTENLSDIFTVHFGKTSGTCRITELIPDKKIVWDIIDCYLDVFRDKTQWKGTSIIWEFSSQGSLAKIDMTHVGLTPALECYGDCESGWTFFVRQSLYALLTEGKGYPGTGIRARIGSSHGTYEGTLFAKEDPVPEVPGSFVLIDVKERNGEEVISSYSISTLKNGELNPGKIRGSYYMIVDNKPVFGMIPPAEDLAETIK